MPPLTTTISCLSSECWFTMPSNIPCTPNLCFHLPPSESGLVHEGPLATIGDLFEMVAMHWQFDCPASELRLLPDNSLIPDLIHGVDITVQDVNSVLFVIDTLPNIDKVRTLMACLMLIWLAIRLTPPEEDNCEHFHQALTTLCRFCDLLPTQEEHDTLTPVPDVLRRPIDIPPTPTPSHPDDVNADMYSDEAHKAVDSPIVMIHPNFSLPSLASLSQHHLQQHQHLS